MAIETPILSQFNAGEWSPLLQGRVDTEGYFASARTMVNMIPSPWGPGLMRPGARFIAEVQDSDNPVALVNFEYSTVQAYMNEAGEKYFIPYKDKARIEVLATDAAISNGDFTSNITGWDDRSTGGAGNQISHDSTNGRLSLTPSGTAADDIGWAEQDVAVGASYQAVEHVLLFDVVGAAGDQVEVQIGTASTGAQILGPVTRKVGRHTIAFTPGAATFYVQFRNRGSFREKSVQIDNVSLAPAGPLKIPTPYAAADVLGLRWEQSFDVLYLEHPDYARRRLERYGHTTWSMVELDFEDGPYLAENTTGTTLTPGAATGLGQSLTASSTAGINNDEGFKSTDVGRLVRLKVGANAWGWAVIVGHTSATVVTIDIRSSFTATTASAVWRLGLYCDTLGHAKCGEFHEDRSALGGAAAAADRADFSASGDFPKFTPEVDDDDAFFGVLGGAGANPINWMVSAKVMLVGTQANMADQRPAVVRTNGLFRIGAASATEPLTPGNAQAKPESVTVLAVERLERRMREIKYNFGQDGYLGRDVTIRAEHVFERGFGRLSFQRVPWSSAWGVRGDGQLGGFVYEDEQKVNAWARHVLGGVFQGGNTVVEDTAVIPGTNGDELWLLAKLTVGGATKRYIVVMEDRFTGITAQEDAFFVDFGLTLDNPIAVTGATQASPVVLTLGSGHGISTDDALILSDFGGITELNGQSYVAKNVTATTVELYLTDGVTALDGTGFGAYVAGGVVNKKVTTVSGLDHLEGLTVKVLGDGAIQTDQVVSSGAITLARAAGVVQVGLGYDWILQPQKLEAGARQGTAQITPKQITNLRARLWRSGPFQAGPDADNLQTVSFGPPSLGQATPLATEDKALPFDSAVNEEGNVYLTGSSPLPVHILALVMNVITEEDAG